MHYQCFCLSDDEEEGADGLEILMEAPEGFRNSDEDRFSESQVNTLRFKQLVTSAVFMLTGKKKKWLTDIFSEGVVWG